MSKGAWRRPLPFADLFIKHANEELGREVLGMDAKASELLARYDWPGNLRELNNVIKKSGAYDSW